MFLTKKHFDNAIVFTRAMWWFFLSPQRKKLQKAILVYQTGGLRLCWHFMVARFGAVCHKYKPQENRLTAEQSQNILKQCSLKPQFSIVVPVYNVAPKWLDICISSVVKQHYTNWELILVDDASGVCDLKLLIENWRDRDSRIQPLFLQKNTGIAGATNIGIQHSKGEYIGFLDHDDELTPDALTWITWEINQNPDALWFYSDEDLISTNGKCHSPYFKPDFSPEFLLSNMFTCHFSVYSTKMLTCIEGIRYGFDGSQDHDLALRLSEIVPRKKIIHIPRVLYHWRQIPSSAASGIHAKPKAPIAGRKAVVEAMERRGLKGEVNSYEFCQTQYEIKLYPQRHPKVSIIIPTKNALVLLKKCLDSVRQYTRYPNYEIVVIDNTSTDPECLAYLSAQLSSGQIRVLSYDKPFNHSEMNNIAVNSVDSEFIVFMNNDIEIISDCWLEQLVAVALSDSLIAAVGGLLIYPDRLVQHAGIILGCFGTAGHAHKYLHHEHPGYHGRLHSIQEMSGVTAALALIRRHSFNQIGGFNSSRYPTQYNDVDLCIRLRKHGYRCIYDPLVKAIHHETKTRTMSAMDLAYKERLTSDYSDLLRNDPFYNPNLSLDNERFNGFRPFPVTHQFSFLNTTGSVSNV